MLENGSSSQWYPAHKPDTNLQGDSERNGKVLMRKDSAAINLLTTTSSYIHSWPKGPMSRYGSAARCL